MIEQEIHDLQSLGKKGRLWRRLKLASIEYALGKGMFDVANIWLEALNSNESAIQDINDELLHMRALMAYARIPHYEKRYNEALQRWEVALENIQQLPSFKGGKGFTTSIIRLSIAHAHIQMGDHWNGEQSWRAALEIFKTEKVNYWIPIVATIWLSKIAYHLHMLKGWSVPVIGIDGQVYDVSHLNV